MWLLIRSACSDFRLWNILSHVIFEYSLLFLNCFSADKLFSLFRHLSGFLSLLFLYHCFRLLVWGAVCIMTVVVKLWSEETSSNTWRVSLRFTVGLCPWERHESMPSSSCKLLIKLTSLAFCEDNWSRKQSESKLFTSVKGLFATSVL